MKEKIAELEDRHQRNNLRFMGIMEKSGVESETWEESETKVKVLREHIGKKEERKKGPSQQIF